MRKRRAAAEAWQEQGKAADDSLPAYVQTPQDCTSEKYAGSVATLSTDDTWNREKSSRGASAPTEIAQDGPQPGQISR